MLGARGAGGLVRVTRLLDCAVLLLGPDLARFHET
jgi:hypothetical protein